MPRSFSYSDYYRDRTSESDLCNDFPGDEILIDGLHAMQTHMWNNGVNLDLPVVRIMNTAHFLAAYMFSTTCSGDQMEYDALANMSLGRDKQLFKVAIIVLAAMLKRTDGFRAQQCRNMLLDNRDADFEEGVTLYDRFLHSAETRFEEEDFLIDTHTQIQKLIALNEQKDQEIATLRYTITTMEKQLNNTQYNNCVIYNAEVYNTNTTNNYYSGQAQTTPEPQAQEPADEPEPQPQPAEDIWGIPRKGKYTEVRRYIDERKKGDPQFKDFCRNHSLRDLCAFLTEQFGWDVDEHSLGANLNRNR